LTTLEAQFLIPFVAEFKIAWNIGVSKADGEYIVLLSTVAILAYELLIIPEIACQKATKEFLAAKFHQAFCEPELCRSMILRL